MNRYQRLIDRARSGEPVLIDGATGSECLRRGTVRLPNGWSGGAVLSNPEIVLGIHADYLALGAEMIASNTFATGRNVLEDAGVADDFALCNRRAIELAIEARARAGADHVLVAGGISNWSFSGNRPSLDTLRHITIEQATIMRDAGADLLSLEMMVDMERLEVTLDAVSTVGLPIWVGFSIGPEEGQPVDQLSNPVPLRDDGLLADAVALTVGYQAVDVLCIMHSDVRLTARGIEEIRRHWDGPIGAYAHAAQRLDGELNFEDVISPEHYADYCPAWLDAGATIIGGCCGIGPKHMEVVAETLLPR